MKQSYFTSPGFTFRLQPFGTPTALFLLFFLLNFSFGFGQGVTISSPQEPGPTEANPIEVLFEFSDAVNQPITGSLGLDNATVLSEERLIPAYENFNSLNLPTRNIQASLNDFLGNYYILPFLGGEPFNVQLQEYLTEKFKNLIVAFDINSNEDIYYLTFANGVFKYNVNNSDQQIIPPGEFESPIDILIDNEDRILIADNDAYSVKVFSPLDYTRLFEIGGDQGADSDEFYGPTGLAKNANNDIYVVDTYPGEFTGNDPNNKVVDKVKVYQITDESFNYIDFFGKNELDDPFRLAVDSNNNVYVSDSGGSNGRIRIFDTDGILKRTIASSSEHSPASIAIDTFGYIYVADYNGDITFNGIYQNPLDLLSKFDELKGNTYSIDVYKPLTDDFNTEIITTFEEELKLPLDLTLNYCENILVLDLDFGGKIDDADFDFDIEMFRRNDRFKLLVEPNSEGMVKLELNSPNLYKCGPQPEGVFSIEYKTEAAPEPTVTCPSNTSLPELSLDANCDPILPTNWADIIETENFADENFSVIDENISDNILTIKVEVLDGSELIETCELHFELIDEIEPEITCPDNITREIPSGEDSIVINYDLPEVSDNCSENLTPELIGGQASGTAFEEGVYTIEYEVTDDADLTSTCSFTITVTQEETQPSVTCPDNADLPELSLDQNCDYELPPFADIIETENFDDLNFSVSENRVDNTLNVEVEVLDGSELIETCSLQFELIDEIEPEITCPEDITREIPAGEDSIVINYDLPQVSDNCSENLTPELIGGQASGTAFQEGVHTIEYEVTDDAGLTAICGFTITVTQEEPAPYSFECIDELTVRLGEEAQNSGVEEIATSEFIISETSNLDFELTNQQFTCDDIGTNPLTIRATNRETGESYSCEVDVTVIDVGAPLIICPAEAITTNLPEEGYKVPNFFENRISDNCNNIEDLDLVQDVEPGTILDEAGTYTINFTATDSYDNEETCRITLILEEDNPDAPEIECVTHELFLDQNGEVTLNPEDILDGERGNLVLTTDIQDFDCSNLGENTVILTATDPDTGLSDTCVTEVMISDDILPVANCIAPGREFRLENGSVTISPSAIDLNSEDNCEITRTLSEDTFTTPGTKNIILYVEDAAGNTDECSTTIEILPEDTDRVYRCIEEAEIPNITLGEDCELNIPSYTFFVQAQNFNPAMTQTYEKLTEDTYLITVEIREFGSDEFVGECEFLVNVVDLIPPGISCPNDQIESFDPDTGFEVPNYENMAGISDNCGEVSFRQEPAAGEIIYNNITVNLFVEDEGGLEASCSFELELTEADVLNISCLIDKNVNPDDNCSFWLPDYTSNADVNFPGADITQTPPVGTILTESTQIKLTASLNGETDECYFMVNLVDDQDPVANCVSGYVVNLDNNGTASISPEDLDNNSTDNCGIVSMALSQVDFTTADIGDVPVTLTVRDDAGNIDSCETTVEVRGEASGEFECRENIEVFLDENGQANLNIQELFTGNASGLNLEASRLNFTCEDLGAAFIQLDYSGDETGSCTINVDVRDELPPEINTNLVELTLDIEGFAYLEESDISAEDSCSEELIYRFSKTVFTCKDVGMNSVNVEVEDINGNRSDKNIQIRISGEGCDLPEPGENEYLFLYPNPNNGIFTIATPEGMFIEQVRVFDSRGRYIMQQDYNANARFYRMTIQGVEESVYTLQIFTNEGVIVKRAIIKR